MQSGISYNQGEIWLIPFPYSDYSCSKKRPVLIISNNEFNSNSNDILVCQITTNLREEDNGIKLEQKDLITGTLPQTSEIRCHKICIMDKKLFIKKFSKINDSKIDFCIKKIRSIINRPVQITNFK